MRRSFLHHALTVGAFALGLALVAPVDASATTLAQITLDQRTDAAEYIVRGTVTDVWTDLDPSGAVWTVALVEVDEQYKGEELETVHVSSLGGDYGGLATRTMLSPRWSIGEDVVLFLSNTGGERIQPIGAYQGKFTVRLDPRSRQHIVQRFAPAQHRSYDHRFIPLPTADQTLTLDQLLTDVADRLELGWDGQPIPGVPTERLRTTNKLQPGVQ